MLVFSHTITPRLQYVLRFLSQYYGQPIRVTDNADAFRSEPGLKLDYTDGPSKGAALHLKPHGLLFEQGVRAVPVDVFDWKGAKAFFKTGGDYPFDLLAAVFYLLGRYEEYTTGEVDEYGRYPHRSSLAWREGFLHRPLVNLWLEDFRKLLLQKAASVDRVPAFAAPYPRFRFLPTYDIDIAWSYRHKGWMRNAGGLARSVLNRQWYAVKERIGVLAGRRTDPYDCYEWLEAVHRRYALEPVYFFHAGQSRNGYDKNIPTRSPEYRQLVRMLSERHPIGLHPSWASGDREELLLREKKELEAISGQAITFSRQHYIRFRLPHTFRKLLECGIRHDYSMGYGSINGFRASVCTPFYWYDLERETTTDLLLHPFCFMDANARFEQQLSPQEGLEELRQLHREIQSVQGELVTIWHNTFLGTDPLFRGWREAYVEFIAGLYP